MNKKTLFITLTILLLVLAGCGSNKSGTNNQLIDADIRKGTQGIEISFTKNAPADKVFEDSRFPIGLSMNNVGATSVGFANSNSVGSGYLSIGVEKAFIGILNDQDQDTFDLRGKSQLDPRGEETVKIINAQANRIGAQSETHPSTIFVTACYPYQTVVGTSVCVDTDVFGLKNKQKVCTAKDITFSGGQGAPVAVTKVETRMLPDEDDELVVPHFIIHVENAGNGEVLLKDKVRDACSSSKLGYSDFNQIQIEAMLGNERLDCSIGSTLSNDVIKLKDKKDFIRCKLPQGISTSRDPYTTPLRIQLDYGYTFTISKNIIIEKILTH